MKKVSLEFRDVRKKFGGVKALKNITFSISQGTIHSLCGENGAGKSTLMKIISGIYQRDGGEVLFEGESVNFTEPKQALEKGIFIIHQELSIINDLSVAENIFINQLAATDRGIKSQILNSRQFNRDARQLLETFGMNIDPARQAGELSIAEQQVVEICRALSINCKVLILDEPTAVLTDKEIDILFKVLYELRRQGVAIIYISHRLEEVLLISDDITVIKDGNTVCSLDPKKCTKDDIIHAMIGRELGQYYPDKRYNIHPDNAFEIRNLSDGIFLNDISLHVKKGEIVGIAGMVGSGRTELAQSIFGMRRWTKGEIIKDGISIRIKSPSHAIEEKIALIPEDRKSQGVVTSLSIIENLTQVARHKTLDYKMIINNRNETAVGRGFMQKLNIKLGKLTDPVSSLSGGNQQKVAIAKWLHTDCDFFIFDEPTRGVDVGAKREIYHIISMLAQYGNGILIISSEMNELLGCCNRIYVMKKGEISGPLTGRDANEERIMQLAAG
ncbi:sugar ABC transporter ATP-binding protein [Serratia sp. CY54717]|uniref:sugar ABC transporter ATP-binding protein n=1 Tax=Serratia sp. CY54717 TaxID=3383637 RepID=UPI003F9FD657